MGLLARSQNIKPTPTPAKPVLNLSSNVPQTTNESTPATVKVNPNLIATKYNNFAETPAPITPIIPPKPGILSRAGTAIKSSLGKVSDFIAGAAEAPTYTGAKGEVLKNLPNEIVRTILPGAAALQDNPELAAEVTNKDILKSIPKAVGETVVAPAASFPLTLYGATSKYINPRIGLPAAPGAGPGGEVKIKTPIGDLTNVQERIAQEPVPASDIGFAAAAAKHTGFELLNGLFTASLASGLVNPRIRPLTPKGKLTAPSLQAEPGPKSFQLYEPQVYKYQVSPQAFEKIVAENEIGVRTNYNPKNPIFFQASKVGPEGKATGQFFQVRPSYMDEFLNVLKGDPAKVPATQIIPIAEVKAPAIAETRPPVIPPGKAAVEQAMNITVGLTGESGSIKAAIDKIAASKSAPEIASVLDNLGADKTLIPKFSQILTRVDNPETVSKILRSEIKPSVLKLGETIPGQKTEAPAPLEVAPKASESKLPSIPEKVTPTESLKGPVAQLPKVVKENLSLPENVPQEFNPDKYVAEQSAKLTEAQNVGKPSIPGKVSNFLNEAKTKLVDFTAPIEDILDKAKTENNLTIEPKADIHNQIDRVLRAPTLAGQFAKDKGIVDVIKGVDNISNLDQYLIAKHAIELDTRGITTGRDMAKDTALVKAFGPKYEQYAQKVAQYSRDLLDYSVDSGLISSDTADLLKKRYPDYVPFSRVFNELEKNNVYHGGGGVASLSRQTLVRKIEGSERQIESPLQSLLAKTNDAFKQGEKNKAGQLLASYKDLPGNPFQLKDITGQEIKGRDTITFFENGEKKVFETTPDVARAAKSLNVQQLNILGKIFAAPVRVARIGITGINLPFIGANIAKDAVTAFINSSHGLKASPANPVNFVRSLFSAVAHDALYEEMVRAGGAGTSFDIARNQVEQTVGRIRSSRNLPSKVFYTVRHPSELLRAVEDIVGRGEEFTRIQQFRGVKEAEAKAGATPENAVIAGARQARDASVNFARRGEWGTVLNSALLYINAGIQGTRTLLRSLKTNPGATTLKIVIAALMPVAIATVWNMKDPKRKAAYDDIAEYEKQNNIIIVPDNPTKDASGKWNVIKIPLSQEINNLVGTSRRAVEMAFGADPLKFQDFSTAILGTVSPIAPQKGDILSSITPQAIKPTIEAAANTTLFTGNPQVPSSLQKLSPENQVKSYTSGTAREIGGLLNVSPIKVEEFIKGTFGGVGSQALNVIDRVQKALGKKDIVVGGQDIMDAIAARFNKAQGGKADDKTIAEIQALLTKQADLSNATKIKAEALDLELSKLSPPEAKLRFDQLYKDDPKLASAVVTAATNRKLGLTYEEKIMSQLQVANGERAKYIHEQIMKLPADKRAAYYTDLVNKKIISANVAAQIASLAKQK